MTRTQQDQAGDPSPAAETLLRAQDLDGFLRTIGITKYTPVTAKSTFNTAGED